MLLGTVIARLLDEVDVEETLAALGDWVLDGADAQHGRCDRTITHGLRIGSRWGLSGRASDEDWLALMTAADGAANPAAACLKVMIERSLGRSGASKNNFWASRTTRYTWPGPSSPPSRSARATC